MPDVEVIKQTPRDLAAEKAVLGAILLESDCLLDVKEYISAEDFYLTANRLVFQAIETLADQREPIDIVTLNASLESQGNQEIVG